MPQPLPKYKQLLAPGFLVHEFTLPAGSSTPQWDVWKYQWDGTIFRGKQNEFNVP